MISITKLEIYSRYNGDVDMWLRTGRPKEHELMNSDDWHLIDLLIQDCIVLQRGLGSPQRNNEANKRLLDNCESEETVNRIRKLAKESPS